MNWTPFGYGRLAVLVLAGCVALGQAQTLTNITFVAFDVETTGFSTNGNRVVELGAVRIRGGKVAATTNWLVNPGMPIPYMASSVHGITDDMVEGRPVFGTILPAFRRFAGGAVLLAHNAHFDIRFVRAEASRAKAPPPTNGVLNTLRLARAVYPDAPTHRLEALAQRLAIPATGAHRADADSMMLAELFLRYLRSPSAPRTLEELESLCGGRLSF